MIEICHGRDSGGLPPNETVSPSTQDTTRVKMIVSDQAKKCCLPENQTVSDLVPERLDSFRCGLGNDKMEGYSRHSSELNTKTQKKAS